MTLNTLFSLTFICNDKSTKSSHPVTDFNQTDISEIEQEANKLVICSNIPDRTYCGDETCGPYVTGQMVFVLCLEE